MQGNQKLYTKSSVTHASTHSVSLWACLYLSNTWTLMPCWTLWWGVLQTAAHRQASYWAILQGIDPEYHSNTPRHTHTHISRLIDTCLQSSTDVIYQSRDGSQSLVSSCQHTLMRSRFTHSAWIYCHKTIICVYLWKRELDISHWTTRYLYQMYNTI